MANLNGVDTFTARPIDAKENLFQRGCRIVLGMEAAKELVLSRHFCVKEESEVMYAVATRRRDSYQVPKVFPPRAAEMRPEQWFVSSDEVLERKE